MLKTRTHVFAALSASFLIFQSAACAQVFESDSDASLISNDMPELVAGLPRARTARQIGQAHHSKAVLLADLGKTNEAIEEDRQAIESDPNNAGYQIFMGHLLTSEGQLQQALAMYQQVCARFPNQLEYLEDTMSQLHMTLDLISLESMLSAKQASPKEPVYKSDPKAFNEFVDRNFLDNPTTLSAVIPAANEVAQPKPPRKRSKLEAIGRLLGISPEPPYDPQKLDYVDEP